MFEGQKIVVFDCEIKKPIEECSRGWQSHDEMGVSVMCAYDYESGRYRVFDDNNATEGMELLWNADWVVGFNTVTFDWKLLLATYPPSKAYERRSLDFDILREIWISLKLDPDNFSPKTHGGYKLDDVAYETIGMRKTANGALAPVMFTKGRIAELTDYCLEDVRIEKTLFEFVARYGYVVRHGRQIRIPFQLVTPVKT